MNQDRAIDELARQCVASVAECYSNNSTRYFRDLCRLKSAPLLMPLFATAAQPAKEITESFAAFWAVRKHLPSLSLKDPTVTVVCVGDGSTPRTGATFALRSAWNVISIDPALVGHHRLARNIKRLTLDPRKVEDTRTECDGVAIIVAVHSHADLVAAVRSVKAKRIAVVAMPCCVPQELPQPCDVEYEDFGCLSPRRTVKVWREVMS